MSFPNIKSACFYFLFVALLICVLIAFRPIPSLFADNDTGRYIDTFHEVCNQPVSFDWHSRITWETFNLLSRPVCLVENDVIYMFLFALPVPLALLIFGTWSRRSLLIASAFCLSFTSFELMTNALRQSVSLFFLLGAFALRGRSGLQFLFCLCAMLLHDSSVVFIPLLLAVNYLYGHSISFRSLFLYLVLSVVLISVAFYGLNIVYLGGSGALIDLYKIFQGKYEDEQSIWFQIFVAMPAVWVFFMRWFFSKKDISLEEKLAITYAGVILTTTALFFSYITYRFAMTAVTIQIFMAMRNTKVKSRAPVWISSGLIVHMIIYAVFSRNVFKVLFG